MPKLKSLNDLKSKDGGSWKLSDRHRLTYSSQEGKEQVELEASLVAAEEGALVVSVVQAQEKGRTVTSLVTLNGTWRANNQNQLEFQISGRSGQLGDVLTFKGSWTLNENYELIYTYRTRSSKGRTVQLQTLLFKGFWDLSERNRLNYLIEGSSDSTFRFRGAFQTPSILAKRGEIRYLLGAEASGEKGRVRVLAFFGRWRISNKLELEFDLECKDGKKRALKFGAEYQITDSASVTAQLTATNGKNLGVEVILSKDFLNNNARAFVRLRKTLQENAIEAGVTIPW